VLIGEDMSGHPGAARHERVGFNVSEKRDQNLDDNFSTGIGVVELAGNHWLAVRRTK